ncbi:MAG TPA: ADP-glyceromanno-heptose 6-epimerase [Novimethylophilus sp.]|jgi:ADP-L-glycero-D-manno-heptose 6-epimerase|uniref:ADP-glyceromanno-heptose 6-epimerase n=1 Tax=Novimethylophilus sp. TaxID=2137426 RepID=UPI002F41675C
MIVITGGAGMIGSMIAWHLNTREGRDDLVMVDRCKHPEQWQNLCHRRYADYLDKDELPEWLARNGGKVTAVVHMGAISATTERDFNLLVQNNFRYSQQLWNWCAHNKVPLLYASSAATYGSGERGYDDTTEELRPLNGYGYSKHLFDQWVLRQVKSGAPTPPQWCGFKFFNVYGPNEYHKERMASVAFHTYNQVRDTGTMRLFRSDRPEVEDGMQLRDFVYVKDAAAVVAFFLKNPAQSGIFNVGTGAARAFRDLADAVMTSMGREPSITWIDMPDDLKGKYQYYTQANVARLRAAGYAESFHTLEDGVRDYVQNYLMQTDAYC